MEARRSRRAQGAQQLGLSWDIPGLVAGVDEAGRGPLAGPVVAAAVILDDLRPIRGLADSKALSAPTRERLHDEIRAHALCCSVGEASVHEIDELNILQATLLAMRRAVQGLRLKPVKVLVDGNRLPELDVLAEAVVGVMPSCPPFRRRPSWRRCTVIGGAQSSTPCIRSTALMRTRATARPSTSRPCARTAPARCIAAVSRRSRPCWLQGKRHEHAPP